MKVLHFIVTLLLLALQIEASGPATFNPSDYAVELVKCDNTSFSLAKYIDEEKRGAYRVIFLGLLLDVH